MPTAPSNSWTFNIHSDPAAGTVTIPADRLLPYVTLYDQLLTVGEPPVSTEVAVPLPQSSSSPEPAVGLSDSFMLQAE